MRGWRRRRREVAGEVAEVVVAGGGAGAVGRVRAGDGAGRSRGGVAAGRAGQVGLVLAVLEATDVMGEGRVRVAVLPTRIVGADRQRCLGEREVAVDVAELVVAGAAAGAVNRVRAGDGAGRRGAGVAA